MVTIYEANKKRKRNPRLHGFHTFGDPGCPIFLSGPFRENIQSFLKDGGELEHYNVKGMPIWCTLLLNNKNGVVVPLYTMEETVNSPFCNYCRSFGWNQSKRRYHFIIPMDDQWNKPLDASVFYRKTHILYGLIHCNGVGHLICINGVEAGSKYFYGTEVMDLWDRICNILCTRKMTVEDCSKKKSMELRLLYGVAYGHSWFGRWGYQFCKGTFDVDENDYGTAIKFFGSLQLDKIVKDFNNSEPSGRYIDQIVKSYRQMNDTQLTTIRDLLMFMLSLTDKSPVQRKSKMLADVIYHSESSTKVSIQRKGPMEDKPNSFASFLREMAGRWPPRRLEYAAKVIVNALREKGSGMSRQELRDAARLHIGDTGLLDFVIKSIHNHIVDDYMVCRTVNPTTKVSQFEAHYAGAEPDLSTTIGRRNLGVVAPVDISEPPGVNVYQDIEYLYQQVLESYPRSELVELAAQVILDSKHFVKEWPLKEDNNLLRFARQILPTSEDLRTELAPSELVDPPPCHGTGELNVRTFRPMKSTTMPSERSNPLHNFPMPSLQWGNQRFLRCQKETTKGETSSDFREVLPFGEKSRFEKGNQVSEGQKGVGEKLLFDLHRTADKMKVQTTEEKEEEASAAVLAAKPWNLRTRRAACKDPCETGPRSEKQHNSTPHFSLSADEIKEDFLMMTGEKPPRRPKKRPRIVQKQLDTLLPGSWLSDITADSYKVTEKAERRRQRNEIDSA